MTDRRVLASGLAALLGLGAVAGCGDTTPDAAPNDGSTTSAASATTEPAPVAGLLATVEYSRLFSFERGLALGLRTVRDVPVTVATMQLDTPLFELAPPTERSMLLLPGGREVVASVAYGAPRCDGDADDVFEAVVVLDSGEAVRVPAPEKFAGIIGRLHARECGAEAVREAITLELGDEWEVEGSTATGELVIEARRPGGEAAVEQLAGSVIFELQPARGDPIVEVDEETPRAMVPVTLSAERCDPHALIESKKTFVFVAWVRVDDAETVPVELTPDEASRAVLDDIFATCMG